MHEFETGSEVHIWLIGLHEIESAWPDWMGVLSGEEVLKTQNYRNGEDRRRFSLTRACLRELLSRYTGIPAVEIDFLHGMYGKPHVKNEHGAQGFDFSVSHSGEYAMYGFSRKGQIGVDIERVRIDSDLSDILPDICTSEELHDIQGGGEGGLLSKLYRYWTLKEAYIKAIGLGLSHPLKDVRISVSRSGYSVEAEGPWAVFQFDGIPEYIASALASGAPSFILKRGIAP